MSSAAADDQAKPKQLKQQAPLVEKSESALPSNTSAAISAIKTTSNLGQVASQAKQGGESTATELAAQAVSQQAKTDRSQLGRPSSAQQAKPASGQTSTDLESPNTAEGNLKEAGLAQQLSGLVSNSSNNSNQDDAVKDPQYEQYRQTFANLLASHAQENIAYPRRSQMLKQTGKVIARVTIDRKGNILRVDFDIKAEYVALNKAVERGLKRAEPFPDFPMAIDGESFTFLVPVNFSING